MNSIQQKTIDQIGMLAAEAIEKANSGHPGLPLGAAPIAYALFHECMKFDASHPDWVDRDRFVLSAGHGSALLYTMLHLYGYEVGMEDLKNFRQLKSRTPGHPELGCLPGVETTTGPLGAGFSNAVGMALAERRIRALFGPEVCDHRTWVLASDGDLMEGIVQEAASIAGHQKLDRLAVFYDSNRISIEGSTEVTFTEDTVARFRSLGWAVAETPGEDPEVILAAWKELDRTGATQPKLLVCHTVIAKGAGKKEGTAASHGSPLGKEILEQMRQKNGIQPFVVDSGVIAHMAENRSRQKAAYEAWTQRFDRFSKEKPDLHRLYEQMSATVSGSHEYPEWKPGTTEATRKSSGRILQVLAAANPALMGGSADLAPSNNSWLDGFEAVSPAHPDGRNIHFGIREHAMGGIVNGLALHGQVLPFGATFLVFSDYMRPAVRLSAIMKLPVIWIFTHDSIHVGEDGPTHQPVEHADALRLIPDLRVIRPADGNECVAAYRFARSRPGPTALLLSRQNLPQLEKSTRIPEDLTGYVLEPKTDADIQLFASGSEVSVALEASALCAQKGKSVEVISVPMLGLQDPGNLPLLVQRHPGARHIALEAGTCRLFAGFGISERIGISTFGECGPGPEVAAHFQLTAQQVADRILSAH